MDQTRDDLLALINKRLTLNLLIQGAAAHTTLTSHHLVRDELNAIDPRLVPLYDKFAAAMDIAMWRGDLLLFTGPPMLFWKWTRRPGHPFRRHPFLTRCGAALAADAKRHAFARARAKRVSRLPVVHTFQIFKLMWTAQWRERNHKPLLEILARRAAGMVWGIPEHRFDAALTMNVAFGRLRTPRTISGNLMRASAIAYGGVIREGGRLKVVAKGQAWPLLAHELVKGTAELVCMHGLNKLDPETYEKVTKAADRIEYEPYGLQVGPELWRRLLPLVPDDSTLPETLMKIARLPPRPLESLMIAIVEEPDWARELIAGL